MAESTDNKERIDETGFGGIRVIQTGDFGYGVDAVLLAAFAAGETGACGIRAEARAADLGTGCGIVAFIISHKTGAASVTGYEKQPEAAERASRACILNGLEDKVDIVCCDIKEIRGVGDHGAVVSNPPYFRRGGAIPSSTGSRYISRHETTADIRDFAIAASSLLAPGGSFYLVHRPDRLPDIFEAMRQAGIEPKELQMVAPRPGAPANIVLIRGVKGAGPELRLLPELTVRDQDGRYTAAITRIYERDI